MQKKLKLLIVDDEKDVRELIKHIYEKKGFIAYSASTGKLALKLAKKTKPDIALVDLYLSKAMDGIETVSGLKKIAPDCVSAMLTWDVSEEKVKKAKSAGAVCYLAKPITVKQLDKTIEKLTKRIKKGGK